MIDNPYDPAPPRPDGPLVHAGMAAIGLAAGLSCWTLVEVLPDVLGEGRILLALASLALAGFAAVLALSGPARLRHAGQAALILALPLTALVLLASLRFDSARDFVESGFWVAAYLVVLLPGMAFVAAALSQPAGWRDYRLLFDIAWTVLLRQVVGLCFTGLVWVVLMLSSALLKLVWITVIQDMLEIGPVPWAITGAALGLGLSVAHDLRGYLSPLPILRLLRLLAPVLLVVVGVFLVALPLRGFGRLFGGMSPALLLLCVGAGAVSMIAAAADRDRAGEAQARLLRLGAQGLSLLLVPLAGLALWSVAARIGQYGVTPARLAAALSAGLLVAYALAYGAAVLGRDWGAGVRRANPVLALAMIATGALWLTPLLNAEALSARSQERRLAREVMTAAQLPVYEMAFDWGRPGRAALARIAETAEVPLSDRIARVLAAGDARSARMADLQDVAPDERAALLAALPVLPAGQVLPSGALDGLARWQIDSWQRACARRDAQGQPGCLLLFVPFRPGEDATEAVLLLDTGGSYQQISLERFALREGQLAPVGGLHALSGSLPQLTRADLAAAQAGRYEVAPAQLNALHLGGQAIIPDN